MYTARRPLKNPLVAKSNRADAPLLASIRRELGIRPQIMRHFCSSCPTCRPSARILFVFRRQEFRMQRHLYEWPSLAENRWPNDGRKLTPEIPDLTRHRWGSFSPLRYGEAPNLSPNRRAAVGDLDYSEGNPCGWWTVWRDRRALGWSSGHGQMLRSVRCLALAQPNTGRSGAGARSSR